jgi:hypothetical protein
MTVAVAALGQRRRRNGKQAAGERGGDQNTHGSPHFRGFGHGPPADMIYHIII